MFFLPLHKEFKYLYTHNLTRVTYKSDTNDERTLSVKKMALLSTTITHPSLFFKIPNPNKPLSSSLSFTNPKIHFPRFLSPSLHVTHSSLSDPNPNPRISDEWGEPSEPEPEPEPESPPDPPMSEDEWGVDDSSASASASAPVTVSGCTKEEEEEEYVTIGNGSTPTTAKDKADVAGEGDRVNKLTELKRCLVDTFYGTELGFRAGPEVRAEVSELVAQLEAANPTPAPTDSTALLDGDWVLLYTAFSELLPLLAAGTTPLLKVKEIRQAIDTSSLTILNSTTLSSPFATFSFSASATFEVRSSTRIQVAFKEGTFQPPEIKTSIDLPENVDVFGQRINLLPVQQSLSPLQDAVASISRVISGQPPLKVPIPGDRTSSWLLITYLDDDFRISRGDGGLFVLAKVGSTLLDQ